MVNVSVAVFKLEVSIMIFSFGSISAGSTVYLDGSENVVRKSSSLRRTLFTQI